MLDQYPYELQHVERLAGADREQEEERILNPSRGKPCEPSMPVLLLHDVKATRVANLRILRCNPLNRGSSADPL